MSKYLTLAAIIAACGTATPVVSELDQMKARFERCKKSPEMRQLATAEEVGAACAAQVYDLQFSDDKAAVEKCAEGQICAAAFKRYARVQMTAGVEVDIDVPMKLRPRFHAVDEAPAPATSGSPSPAASPATAASPSPAASPVASPPAKTAVGASPTAKKDDVGDDLPDFDLPDPPKAKAKGK